MTFPAPTSFRTSLRACLPQHHHGRAENWRCGACCGAIAARGGENMPRRQRAPAVKKVAAWRRRKQCAAWRQHVF
jgi:hypothetical protein